MGSFVGSICSGVTGYIPECEHLGVYPGTYPSMTLWVYPGTYPAYGFPDTYPSITVYPGTYPSMTL